MGSFWRRYPFVRPGKNLHRVVEAWTKGDTDILITYEALEAAGVMTRKEIENVDRLIKDIAEVVCRNLAGKGIHIIDGKFELGRLKHGDGKIVLIDEISPDVLRTCNGYAFGGMNGLPADPLTLAVLAAMSCGDAHIGNRSIPSSGN